MGSINRSLLRLTRHRDSEFQIKHTILNTFITLNGILIGSILTIITIKNNIPMIIFGLTLITLNIASIIILLFSFRLALAESRCWQIYHSRKIRLIKLYEKSNSVKYNKKRKQTYDKCKSKSSFFRKRVEILESSAKDFVLISFIFLLISITIL